MLKLMVTFRDMVNGQLAQWQQNHVIDTFFFFNHFQNPPSLGATSPCLALKSVGMSVTGGLVHLTDLRCTVFQS